MLPIFLFFLSSPMLYMSRKKFRIVVLLFGFMLYLGTLVGEIFIIISSEEAKRLQLLAAMIVILSTSIRTN